ncbi:MAG: hypothetical protein A2505_07585 [Deltaproteobacteria bacterium RIFOXYD12_FULL_55_16]|nr:MAG: hypothetical protein A2505_07585 [Deltaproteobacteria bacterium RIFOXYD12_FULL_55_16]
MMAIDAARQPEMAVADTVVVLYEELAEVTASFLETFQDGSPDEGAQAFFWAARIDLVGRLQPLLARQKQAVHGDGLGQQPLALQLQKMERLAALDAQVLSRLAALQAEIGADLKALGQGKKGLAGYRVGLKGEPRFCRKTA